MKLKNIIKNSDKTKLLKKGFKKVFKTSNITLALLASLTFSSSLSAYTSLNIPLTTHNTNLFQEFADALGLHSSNIFQDKIKSLDKNIKTIVFILDNEENHFTLFDKYNTIRELYKFSHMDLVKKVITTDLNNNNIAIIESNIFNKDNYHVIDSALKNIEEVLINNPTKQIIINMSFGDGINFFGKVPYHTTIIDMIKKYPNLKISKSAGNSTYLTSQLHFLFKSIKPSQYHSFLEKKFFNNDNPPSLKEIRHFFNEKIMAKAFILNFSMYKELYFEEQKNFKENLLFEKTLQQEYISENNSLEEKERLSKNLILVKGYSFSDFVEAFKMNNSMRKIPEVISLYKQLEYMNLIENKFFNNYKYKLFFNKDTYSSYRDIEKKLISFIKKYQNIHPEFFNVTSINAVANDNTVVNTKYGLTNIIRFKKMPDGEVLKLMCTGTSTSAPAIINDFLLQQATTLKKNKRNPIS